MFIICLGASFTFALEGGTWDLILLILDHCLSFYFDPYVIIYEKDKPFVEKMNKTNHMSWVKNMKRARTIRDK